MIVGNKIKIPKRFYVSTVADTRADLLGIRVHLEKLKQVMGLGDKLVARLEASLANVHTPVGPEDGAGDTGIMGPADQSWQIFDQASLQSMMYSNWMV